MYNRVLCIVLDSVGVGNAPDADKYGDEGANTLLHVYESANPKLNNMADMGLLNLIGKADDRKICGVYGRAIETSAGKDTTTGHWEMAGLQINNPFPTYPNGFPTEIIEAFEESIGTNIMGNYPASGTEIIAELGDAHVRTGYPIVYTSADSVFQIACHEDIYPVEQLYDMCKKARKILSGKNAVGRVIARPFVGENGEYTRSSGREDFSVDPFDDTILDVLKNNNYETYGVGKIENIFNHRGFTDSDQAHGNIDCIKATYKAMDKVQKGFIFVNLVDTDMIYGHRRDPVGYAKSLEYFDLKLAKIKSKMKDDDLLIITADHGCDPTYKGTDHTRETVPIIAWSKQMKAGNDLGVRKTFRDIAATIAENFEIKENFGAKSFYKELI